MYFLTSRLFFVVVVLLMQENFISCVQNDFSMLSGEHKYLILNFTQFRIMETPELFNDAIRSLKIFHFQFLTNHI